MSASESGACNLAALSLRDDRRPIMAENISHFLGRKKRLNLDVSAFRDVPIDPQPYLPFIPLRKRLCDSDSDDDSGSRASKIAKYRKQKYWLHNQMKIYRERALMEDPSLDRFELEKRVWDMVAKGNQRESENFKAKGLMEDDNIKARGIKDCLMENDA